jgi:hypothetical protein
VIQYVNMLVFCVVLIFSTGITQAQTYLQINGASLHDRSGYNGWNWGAGLEQGITPRWTVAGGWYYNSERRGSTYAYGRYAVYKKDSWDLGVSVGAVTGYNRAAVVPMAFPEACYGWVCGLFAPRVESTGANVIGFRLRIPVN